MKDESNFVKFVSQCNVEDARKFLESNGIDVSNEDVVQIGYLIESICQNKNIENVSGGVTPEIIASVVCGSVGVIWDTIEFSGATGWGQDLFYTFRNSTLGTKLGPETSANVTAGIGGVSHLVTGAAYAGLGCGTVKFVKWLKNRKEVK